MRKVLTIVGICIVVLAVLSFMVGNATNDIKKKANSVTVTPQAQANTFRDSFISGCKQESVAEQTCGCMYDKLSAMYPDFNTNTQRINRIVTDGYTQVETDTIVTQCVNQPTSQIN